MKVYQLRFLGRGLNFLLEPVFATIESAELFRQKYQNRSILVEENKIIGEVDDKYIYRACISDEEGEYLFDEVFGNIAILKKYLDKKEHSNYKIIRDNLLK